MFGLIVYLKIESSRELALDFKEVTKQLPEFGGEKWAFVGHYWITKAMVPK